MDNRRTVLLADANEEFRTMLREAVEKSEEFTVVGSVGDGTAALLLISQRHPELVVMDVMLPGVDGMSLLRQMKDQGVKKEINRLKSEAVIVYPHGTNFFPNAMQMIKRGGK